MKKQNYENAKITEKDMYNFIEKIMWNPEGLPIYHKELSKKEKRVALYLHHLGYVNLQKFKEGVQYAINEKGMIFFINAKMLKYTKKLNIYTISLIIVGVLTLIVTIINIWLIIMPLVKIY